MDDPYQVLGLAPGADAVEVDRAYRKLVRRYPPELNPQRFAGIHRAYQLLTSPGRLMEEVARAPEEALAWLFPPPRVTFRADPAAPGPLRPEDFEPLLAPLRRALLERALREGWDRRE